ncbi:sucrose-specific PTS transporter subunit IIBC [Trinickia caryophylli]|uniref:PTS system sucrose-specific IIB component, Glc family /PTS system sucrose-specific IIC component, Glc family n=1 Tax=Trinickia caryophylli TaxID=28094 RepID=A0A1X7EA53_TRICW|nr:sucrose-specific PTS transporter subunit IIBC [Trinickia caryophylli]PMS12990.1 PTS sucrose transporter subunit IIBC [Trinickia caryophylli]TRX14751.1 PTS sucrose transporter subunit IIBC [Trinickia caryophylli]WQE14598.1 sucrose-specific PTS transporter subunit IIBC [Trinickia caryophylli]SMF30218.1 PTS system sucrose-specific IIB component, Glc family /PTS system sucrose-specific IIC component, Glc family [Trinickia caryophylli]GLU31987.1 PTS sugar transporter [Trinickia caryophylli]
MTESETAKALLPLIGGSENVLRLSHCATRLRLVVRDGGKVDHKAIGALEIVKGSFSGAGQVQIIVGQSMVGKVHDALHQLLGERAAASLEALKQEANSRQNAAQRLARTLSNIFVPIIPVIVASGLLMGLLGMLKSSGWAAADSAPFQILGVFASTAFVFLPILIAFSCARDFGVSPFLAAALAGIMIHPDLQNAWTLGNGVHEYWNVFGIEIAKVGYQGTVLPVLLAVWMMGWIERGVKRLVPNSVDLIFTPFLTLLISGAIALTVVAPIGRTLGDGLSFALQAIYRHGGAVAGIVFGGLYSTIVITGIHHSFHAIEAALLANPEIGVNFLLPIWAMANFAQGGAALAVFFTTRDPKIRQVSVPAALSCLMGITEAAIFGVNLRFFWPFVFGALGGAVGGGWVVATHVGMTGIGLTGLPGLAIVRPDSFFEYLIGGVLAFSIAFVGTLLRSVGAKMPYGEMSGA